MGEGEAGRVPWVGTMAAIVMLASGPDAAAQRVPTHQPFHTAPVGRAPFSHGHASLRGGEPSLEVSYPHFPDAFGSCH